MQPHYLGVDIAGYRKTWMCVLTLRDGKLVLAETLRRGSLEDIVKYTEEKQVVAVAIDAQLTWAASEARGFRSSDKELRKMLPYECQNWVASQNSLAAVPVRGRQLAEILSPTVGTIIETHPRACLYFANRSLLELVKLYKKPNGEEHARKLWEGWTDRFSIDTTLSSASDFTDDALDALVCATIGYLFHNSPQRLWRLSHSAVDKRGRGPFLVSLPDWESELVGRDGSV